MQGHIFELPVGDRPRLLWVSHLGFCIIFLVPETTTIQRIPTMATPDDSPFGSPGGNTVSSRSLDNVEDEHYDYLPNYMLQIGHRADRINLDDVTEEAGETGAGGDSDDEDDGFLECDEAMRDAIDEEAGNAQEDEDAVADDDRHSLVLKQGYAPEINIPSTPDDWVAAAPKTTKGEPASFIDVDNPGGWCNFSFRPEFDTKQAGTYKHPSQSTGVTPVPLNQEGHRKIGGWNFEYKGWKSDVPDKRHGATQENIFPKERQGSLDADKLLAYGLTKERLAANDALFFFN